MQEEEGSQLRAPISNIQRYSIQDGPGIRTVVFFSGCPLRCPWCQNPETLESRPAVMFNRYECIGCLECVQACAEGATYVTGDGRIEIDRGKCRSCAACLEVCPPKARKVSARSFSIRELLAEILKDDVFFDFTRGGVTFSGGEPTLYADFLLGILKRCKSRRLHTAIETCGYADEERIAEIGCFVDLFLFDIKLFDPQKHKKWIGVDNRRILHNLEQLVKAGKSVVVRIPLIPGVNDDGAEFDSIIRFCADLKGIDTIHIMPFHQIGSSKYESLGKKYDFGGVDEENDAGVKRCVRIAEARGFFVSIGGGEYLQARDAAPQRSKSRYFIFRP